MSEQNLSGWERAASIAAGIAAIGLGVRRGGLGGWVRVGAGVLAAKRGLSGHCQVKAALNKPVLEPLRSELAAVVPSPGVADSTVSEARIDHALEETFPASDPISP